VLEAVLPSRDPGTDLRLRGTAIAFCPETGANLCKSRRSPWYMLVMPLSPDRECLRFWHSNKVHTDESAIARAQWSINNVLSKQQARA
jgi:hypothetical protein